MGWNIPNNIVRVPCTKDNFFRWWLDFLSPLHHLTDRELDVAAAFLKERYTLSKKVSDEQLLDRILMSEEIQRKIKQDCGLTNQHFQVIKSKLKNKGILKDNALYSRLIPKIKDIEGDVGGVQLLLYFEFSDKK